MILYGKPIAQEIYQELKKKIDDLEIKPSLAVVLVGEDPASLQYVHAKEKIAEEIGIGFKLYHLPGIVLEDNLINLICDLNKNKYISGIVVQLPLPKEFDTEKMLKAITPTKDIDGFSGKYSVPTAQAILEILKFYNIDIKNKNILIVGHGRLVGEPLEKILLKQRIQPNVCDSSCKDLAEQTLRADIIVSCAGIPGLIKANMVSKRAIVIDAGTAESSGKIVGDVDKEVYDAKQLHYNKVSSYSPTPGGVGPVTVAMLMKNLVEATK